MKITIIAFLLIGGCANIATAQKGEKSIAAGIFVALNSHKHLLYPDGHTWNNGAGLEVTGQYNFTDKSAALVQIQLTRFSGQFYSNPGITESTSTLSFSLKAGYRYQFTPSGFYANVLAGIEGGDDQDESGDYDKLYVPVAIGIGKRFTIMDNYFIDTGIDYYASGFINRFNLKVVFIVFRRPKP